MIPRKNVVSPLSTPFSQGSAFCTHMREWEVAPLWASSPSAGSRRVTHHLYHWDV